MLGENRPKMDAGGSFEAFPSGVYTLQIADIDAVKESWQGVESDKFKFTFFILTNKTFKSETGKELNTRGRRMWKSFSIFISPKSNLMSFIKTIDPSIVNMTTEQKENYNLDLLVGKQINALISKDQSKTSDSIYNNIKSFEKCEEELEGFKDLSANPVIINKESVPVEAPAETATPVAVTAPVEPIKSESSADFVASLKKESEAAKQPTLTEETPAQKKVREANEAIAKIKADAGITE